MLLQKRVHLVGSFELDPVAGRRDPDAPTVVGVPRRPLPELLQGHAGRRVLDVEGRNTDAIVGDAVPLLPHAEAGVPVLVPVGRPAIAVCRVEPVVDCFFLRREPRWEGSAIVGPEGRFPTRRKDRTSGPYLPRRRT